MGDQQGQVTGCKEILLLFTSFIITTLSVDEQNSEVHDIEISDWGIEAGWKRPGNSHDEITARLEQSTEIIGKKKKKLESYR